MPTKMKSFRMKESVSDMIASLSQYFDMSQADVIDVAVTYLWSQLQDHYYYDGDILDLDCNIKLDFDNRHLVHQIKEHRLPVNLPKYN